MPSEGGCDAQRTTGGLEVWSFRWPQYDPGPPWWFDVVSKEIQVELVLSQLQFEKEVLASQSKAIDRQIQALQGQKR